MPTQTVSLDASEKKWSYELKHATTTTMSVLVELQTECFFQTTSCEADE